MGNNWHYLLKLRDFEAGNSETTRAWRGKQLWLLIGGYNAHQQKQSKSRFEVPPTMYSKSSSASCSLHSGLSPYAEGIGWEIDLVIACFVANHGTQPHSNWHQGIPGVKSDPSPSQQLSVSAGVWEPCFCLVGFFFQHNLAFWSVGLGWQRELYQAQWRLRSQTLTHLSLSVFTNLLSNLRLFVQAVPMGRKQFCWLLWRERFFWKSKSKTANDSYN